MHLPRAAVMGCLIAAGAAGGCSFLSPVRGTLSNGATFTGYLSEGGRIQLDLGRGIRCHGQYSHWLSFGGGTVHCDDGRQGEFSMLSTPSIPVGPGHGSGEAAGTFDGQPFRFAYGGSLPSPLEVH
jgi:hypothetical protein